MNTTTRVVFAGGLFLLIWVAQIPAQQQRPRPDSTAELRGRHPLLFDYRSFVEWLDGRTIGPWHESPSDRDSRLLVVQDAPGNSVFAAQVVTSTDEIQGSHVFDLQQDKKTRRLVLDAAAAAKFTPDTIHAVRPNVSYSNNKWTLEWEVEVRKGTGIDSYVFTGGSLTPAKSPLAGGITPGLPTAGKGSKPPDDMATNELHHPAAFAAEAAGWIKAANATTVQEKAYAIFEGVAGSYFPDSTIRNINDFTWADELTRTTNKRRGMCDELAVVTISYLRSAGIPARLKILNWVASAKNFGHAVVEYSDGGTWRHMDPMWKRPGTKEGFNDEGMYRRRGHSDVTVMDADWPDDSKYTLDAWGTVPDPTGDGKLNPWEDFKIDPSFPGNKRKGYSYP